MAKINDTIAYPPVVPEDADIVIGSDGGSGGATKNFKMSAIKTYVNDGGLGTVTSVSSTNPAITVATGTTTPVLTSTAYTGTTNIGHVPTGGNSLTYLKGDGTWATPLVTSSILYATGGSQGIAASATTDLPTTPFIFRPFTRTDVFQVEQDQVLKYEAGHSLGTEGTLRSINVSGFGNWNDPVPSASVTVSRIKI